MSVDVTYYSFSPKRADDVWAEKGKESVKAMRQTSYESISHEQYKEIERVVDESLSPHFQDLRARILARLGKPLHEYNIDPEDLGAIAELGNDEDRDEFERLRLKRHNDMTDAKQAASRERYSKGLVRGLSKDEIMHELIELDLTFGAIATWFEYPEFEDSFQRLFSEKFGIPLVDDSLDRQGWIEVITSLKERRDVVEGVIDSFGKEWGYSKEEAEEQLIEYLNSISALLKDLKNTDDALFYRDYGDESQPKSVADLLQVRGQQHLESYRELLPIRNKSD